MSDLRYRLALRTWMQDPCEENAIRAFHAAIRAGAIDVGREPSGDSIFGDWAICFVHNGIYERLSPEGRRWVDRHDVDIMKGQVVVDIYEDDIDESDEAPEDVAKILNAAGEEGYNYVAFE